MPVRSATSVVRSVAGNRVRTRSSLVRSARRVAIDGHDPAARPEQVREGERERSLPCPDVRPCPARVHGRAEQADVVGVVHGQPVLWSPAATPLTVSWTSRSTRSRSGSPGGEGAQPGEQADLELGQRVDVGIAERDGALQDRRPVEQPLVPGHARQEHRRSGGIRSR